MRYDLFNHKSTTSEVSVLLCRDTDKPWRLWLSRGNNAALGFWDGVTCWWELQIGYWTLSFNVFTASADFGAAQALVCT